MEKGIIIKVDSMIEKFCEVCCKHVEHINTDKVIALVEAVGKLLAARAALEKD